MTDSHFEKKFRLLSVSDFSELKVGSLCFKTPCCIIYYKKNLFNQSRIGLSVPKKIGKAHDRNRIKRIIREGFRQSEYKFLGHDVLIVISWNRNITPESAEVKEATLLNNIDEFFIYLQRQITWNSNQNKNKLDLKQ